MSSFCLCHWCACLCWQLYTRPHGAQWGDGQGGPDPLQLNPHALPLPVTPSFPQTLTPSKLYKACPISPLRTRSSCSGLDAWLWPLTFRTPCNACTPNPSSLHLESPVHSCTRGSWQDPLVVQGDLLSSEVCLVLGRSFQSKLAEVGHCRAEAGQPLVALGGPSACPKVWFSRLQIGGIGWDLQMVH